MYTLWESQKEKVEGGRIRNLTEAMAENLPNLGKEMYIKNKEAQQTSNKINQRNPHWDR